MAEKKKSPKRKTSKSAVKNVAWPLRYKLGGAVAIILLSVTLLLSYFQTGRWDDSARRWSERRASGMALILVQATKPGIEFNDAATVETYLAWLSSAPGVLYSVVRKTSGEAFAFWTSEDELKKHDGDYFKGLKAYPVNWGVSHSFEYEKKTLIVVAGIETMDGSRMSLELAFSLVDLIAERRTNLVYTMIFIAMMLIIAVGAMFWISAYIVRPISLLTEATSLIVETGDLRHEININTTDETGVLAESFQAMVERLRSVLNGVKVATIEVSGVTEQLSLTGETVANGTDAVQRRMEQTAKAISEMRSSLSNVAENVEAVHQNSEQAASSVVEMATNNEEVSRSFREMANSVDTTTSDIEQITSASVQMATQLRVVDEAIRDTSVAMAQIHATIQEIDRNAAQTSELVEEVSVSTEKGVATVQRTTVGLEEIRSSAEQASNVIGILGGRIGNVGQILKVINDIAEQTNLLALNASIIAAQAGEHGKGFAVVASEIKGLAERTRGATKEIDEIITAIQTESEEAVRAVGTSVERAQAGVDLAEATNAALNEIAASAASATTMARTIAHSTVQHADGTSHVRNSLDKLAQTVQQITLASGETANSAERVMGNVEQMNGLTQHVMRSSEEQSQGSRQIIKAIEKINEMIGHVSEAQREQTTSSQSVDDAMAAIRRVTDNQASSVVDMATIIEGLQHQTDTLKRELGSFTV